MEAVPIQPPIQIAFELTFDDFHEATRGKPPGERSWGTRLWAIGSWVILLGGVAVLVYLIRPTESAAQLGDLPLYEPRPLITRLALALAPSVVYAVLIVWAIARPAFGKSQVPWALPQGLTAGGKKKINWRFQLVNIVVGVLVAVIVILSDRGSNERPGNYGPLLSDSSFYLPLLAVAIAVLPPIVVITQLQPRLARRAWQSQANLQLPQRCEFSEMGMRSAAANSSSQYAWTYFQGFKETSNLFLLYPSSLIFHIIPKRAFSNEHELARFCGLLQNHVRAGIFLPRQDGFIMQSRPAAIPAIPLDQAAVPRTEQQS